MRRTLTVVLLTFLLTLPVWAQRRGFASHGGGSPPARSSNFVSHGSSGFRGGAVGFRGGAGFRGGVAFGSTFGGNHGVRVIVNSRPFHRPHFSVYPYRHVRSYVYPYVYYPIYPLSFYDSYDYTAYPAQPAYAYDYGYASGGDNYPPDYGLNEQMRQMGVGIYGRPRTATPEAAPQQQQQQPSSVIQQPERTMPATVLIYRDGRRTEVRNYAIVGQTLWTFTERAANKVPLTDLNVNATQKANAERGIDFIVPQP